MTALTTHRLSGPQRVVPLETQTADAPQPNMRAMVEQRLSCDRPRHFRYLFARLRSREDAEDVLQDFSLRALQGASRVREDKIDAWLNVSLRNALFDRYRRNGARRRLSEAAAAEPPEAQEPGDVEEAPTDCLKASLSELKPSYATLLQRVSLEEAAIKQVAAELNLTPNNAAVRLHRAREMLRGIMIARCEACGTHCSLAAGFLARAAA